MNIVVRTYNGSVVVRPDTTWKRGNDDFYAPEFVKELSGSPVFFVRICKAGRSVAARFADRYYDSVGAGLLLYPENLIAAAPEGFATACCLDRTTFLTYPEMDKSFSGSEFRIETDGKEFFTGATCCVPDIQKALEDVSRFCYLRTGDYVAIELAERKTICNSSKERTHLKGSFSGNETLDFNIIF